MKRLTAHIIAIGSELLHGGRIDSNSVGIAEVLAQSGIEVKQKVAVGDHELDICTAVLSSATQADVIVTTGGLGSTLDDCTREAVAAACGRTLVMRTQALRMVQAHLKTRNRALTPVMTRQAFMPSRAFILENPVGTAPGFSLKVGKAQLFVLPGVPREALAMAQVHIPLYFAKKYRRERRGLWSHSLNTVGISETEVQGHVMPLIKRYPSMQFSFLASTSGVKVTVSCWRVQELSKSDSKNIRPFPAGEGAVRNIRAVLAPWLYSEGEERMEEVVGKLLASRSLTLAVAESCTGGLVAHRLTEVPGSSIYVDRGIVSYSNRAKQQLLGVRSLTLKQYGAVSLQVAHAMAKGIRKRSRVDVGLSLTGIAGPSGGSLEKPVGMVCMAIDGPYGTEARQFQFWGNRSEIKFRSSQAGLDFVRRYLLDRGGKKGDPAHG